MPFQGQLGQDLNQAGVQTLVRKLEGKLRIGPLLTVKAQVWNCIDNPAADEVRTATWAQKHGSGYETPDCLTHFSASPLATSGIFLNSPANFPAPGCFVLTATFRAAFDCGAR